jgi:hypothetical protein
VTFLPPALREPLPYGRRDRCVPKARFCNIGGEVHRGGADALDRAMDWSVLVQRAMSPRFIVMARVGFQDLA